MYKKHLLGGVLCAFTAEAAEAKFDKWIEQKAGKIAAKTSKISGDKEAAMKARLEEEKKIKEERAKALEAKRAEEAAAAAAAAAEEAAQGEDATEEAAAPAEEAPAAEA